MTDDGLQIGVANLFISDYVRSHFGERLSAAALHTYGREMPVTFRVQPDLFQNRRAKNLSGEVEAMETLGQPAPVPAPQAAVPRMQPQTELRPLFTLDNFIVGPCNEMAYMAARAAATAPGRDFHPLFIHGGCGLGKTHLLQGILHALRKRGDLQVACLSAEQFTNRYLSGMRTGGLDAFRHRYRNLDVLAIDDIHFLAGKQATQEEFLHTFNEFDGGRRMIILASDSHPREIEAIQDHLKSRFVSGLVVRLMPPDEATRCRIVEGALSRIIAYAALLKQPMTMELAQASLADFVVARPSRISLGEIEEAVAIFFAVTRADIHSARKSHQISLARQVTMVLARQMTDLSFADIARGIGGKNHTTVLAAGRKWQDMVKSGTEIRWADRNEQRSMPAGSLLEHLKDRIRR